MAAVSGATRTIISPARLGRKRGKRIYWILLILLILAFSFIFLGPLYWMATGGLKSGKEIAQVPPTLFPQQPNIAAYKDAWVDLNLGQLLLNTLIYAFGALAFQLVFDVAAAYALSKLRPVLGNAILGLILATLMVPAATLVIPQYVTVIDLPLVHWHMLDSPWAIWLPAVANAFNIFLLKRFFDSVPQELLSAAAVDGAGPLRTLLWIILPISRPILGVMSILSLTAVWKDFLWPLLVEPGENTKTLNVGIYAFSKGLTQNTIIAAAVIAAIPTIVFFLFLQRNIMSGLTAGGLKG